MQGDPLAMCMYALSLQPLISCLQAASAAEDRTAWRQRAYSPILHLENG